MANLDHMKDAVNEMKKENDLVNHPDHYTAGGIEVIDFIEAKGFGYHIGSAVKYISRAAFKGKPQQDLEKAIWFIIRYIAKTFNVNYELKLVK